MRIRDALESDAERLAGLVGRPPDVLVNMVHDRSVRVAVRKPSETAENESGGQTDGLDDGQQTGDGQKNVGSPGDTDDSIVGFVAFDARGDTVHVTDFAAPGSAVSRLFEEPKRFARRESMDVEVVVADEERDRIASVEDAGFVAVGSGPRFENRKTTRFRFETDGE